MIQASELRIGNYVELSGDFHQIDSITSTISGDFIHLEGNLLTNRIEQLKYIPLTEEILLKCGFEFDDDWAGVSIWAEHNKLILLYPDEILDNTFDVRIEYYEEKENCIMLDGIKYLHQLQNLYFALTGNELEIRL